MAAKKSCVALGSAVVYSAHLPSQSEVFMVRRIAFPALLAMLFLLPSFALAQKSRPAPNTEPFTRKYAIRGNVRLEQNERALENIKIELRRFTGEVLSATFTRSNGEFEFAGLDNGDFYLIVEEHGFEPVRQHVQILNSTVSGAMVYLKKISQPGQAEPGDSVSARELSLSRDARSTFRKALDVLYRKHSPGASVELFQKVVSSSPTFYEAYFQMGVAYDQLEKPKEAEEAFRKSIAASNATYPHPLIALASLLTAQGRAVESELLARQGLALDASIWQGHYELGRALAALNRSEEAEKSLRETVRLQNDYPPVYLVLANVHMRLKNQPALLSDLNEFLRLEPNGPQSEQARKMRDGIQRAIEDSKNGSAASPKP